MNYRD
jgi:uncharacterized protein YbjT (DUF2867 family)